MTPFPAHDEAAMRDRFRGTLLGLAAGEALGEPADFPVSYTHLTLPTILRV